MPAIIQKLKSTCLVGEYIVLFSFISKHNFCPNKSINIMIYQLLYWYH